VYLFYDSEEKHWISESEYMDLFTIPHNIPLNVFVSLLKLLFNAWKYDKRYLDIISDEWSEIMKPWYSMLLQQYIPNSGELQLWIQNSRPEQFVHGDFTLSNLYVDRDDKIVVIDFENATLGPALWDETTLVYSLIEQKEYKMAKKIYTEFSCNKGMLYVISCIRLAQSIRKSEDVARRTEVCHYILRYY